jgi:hypothetical protein
METGLAFSQMSRSSLFFVRTVDVMYTDVVGNASPTHAIEWVNVMIGEKILTSSGYMGPGVILLEN